MERRIPDWLGIPWWWVLVLAAALEILKPILHLPFLPRYFVPSGWLLLQAFWIKAVFPGSRGIFLVVPSTVYVIYIQFIHTTNLETLYLHVLIQMALYIAAVIVLCGDFERAFDDESRPMIDVAKLYAVLFGAYYFQYHLHDLHETQIAQAESMRG